jgi:hypothetical protein
VAAVPSVVAQALTQDAFVRLATEGRDAAMVLVRMATRRAALIGVVAAAVGVGAAVAGEQLLGSAWAGLATTSLWLACGLPARLLLGSLVAAAISSGRASSVIVHEIGRGMLTLVATAVGVRWGLAGAALGASVGVGMGVLALRIYLMRWLQPARS